MVDIVVGSYVHHLSGGSSLKLIAIQLRIITAGSSIQSASLPNSIASLIQGITDLVFAEQDIRQTRWNEVW